MKGITPIISIIILLLLTVGLAAAAWSYMMSYFSSITAKTIEISMQKCISTATDDKYVMAVIHNMGTATIDIGDDIVIWDRAGVVVNPSNISWEDIYGNSLTPPGDKIEAGKDVKVNIFCCRGNGCPRTCTYDIVIGGRSQTATSYCS